MPTPPTYYRCGVCGERFDTEPQIREHIATPFTDGDTHDGEPWEVCDDDVCIVARQSSDHRWSFFGAWRFADDTAFDTDEGIGWQVRQLFRMGYTEIRVLHRRDAEHKYTAQPDVEAPHV